MMNLQISNESLLRRLPTVEDIESEESRRACCRSLAEFIRRAWHVVEPGTDLIWNWHLDLICKHFEAVSCGECRRLIVNIPPGHCKALDINTPILTTHGWKPHGDLVPGDFVFAPDGKPVRVLATTSHVLEQSHRVLFDDGSSVDAGEGHLWSVLRDYNEKPRRRIPHIATTTDLRQSGYKRKKQEQRPDAVPMHAPVEMPPQHLLIDPYLLGVWLGDGGSAAGCVYAADQDLSAFEPLGVVSNTMPPGGARKQAFHRIRVDGLQTHLRVLGLLNNKHIPEHYLIGSAEQRWALLQGLMDTDGSCAKDGSCSFTNKNKSLADGVRHLVSSLGMKPHTRSRHTKLKGKLYGPHYRVTFRPLATDTIFRISRKQTRTRAPTDRARRRYVDTVTSLGKRLVNCIQVEGDLYLAGRDFVATHNSLLIAVFWPAWVWTHTPTWRVLFTSYDMGLSTRDSVRCRDVISSDWYQDTFKPTWKLKGDQNVKGHFENTAGGLRQALSMSVTSRGTGFRGDCVSGDDPHNVKEHPSDEELAGVHFIWDKRMSSRLNDPRKGARVVIHQRIHENDLTGHLLKKKNYTHLCLPTEFDPDTKCITQWGEDPRTEPGELLFPELFPPAVIDEAKEDLGEYDFAGQHNQQPAPPGGGIIKQHWFRFWYPEGVDRPKKYMTKMADGTVHWHEQIEIPKRFDAELQSWDMTFKERSKNPKKKPDFVVGQSWAMVRKRRFLLDQVRDRMSFTQAVEAVRQLTAAWPRTELKLVEDAANGPAITDELETEIGGFELVTPAGGKEVRAHSASHTIRAGYLYLPHPDLFPWVKALMHEVCTFPRGANDDQLDAMTQLINHTRESATSVLEAMTR